jgi:nitroimidazol reductase NimA-like FMN-containing flavoprotein (pyridoxamine 5'-phosphate oxidase superfamily)
MTPHRDAPTFHQLDRRECEALLAAHHVGRLAYSFRDKVDIEPIHYVFADGHVYGRTQFGAKVNVLAHHPWVAFEVDDVREVFHWRSVVVHGRIMFPDPAGSPTDIEDYERGVAAFQRLVPTAFTEHDPTPHRELVFVLKIQEITGRAAMPAVRPASP